MRCAEVNPCDYSVSNANTLEPVNYHIAMYTHAQTHSSSGGAVLASVSAFSCLSFHTSTMIQNSKACLICLFKGFGGNLRRSASENKPAN